MKLSEPYPPASVSLPALNDSDKRSEKLVTGETHQKTVALLDRYVPEFETFLEGELIDCFLVPSFGRRYRWTRSRAQFRRVPFTELRRSIYSWMKKRSGHQLPFLATELKTAEWIARRYVQRLPSRVDRLVVMQDYLPFLYQWGVLKGREYEVLLTRPSFAAIYEKLSTARSLLSSAKAKSLADLQVPDNWVEAELKALNAAERVVTPHEEYAQYFERVRKIEWELPTVVPPAEVRQPKALLFPADLSAREGAHAALAVAEFFELPLLVVGQNTEGLAAGSDLVQFIGRGEIPWHEVIGVVHPTLFEPWPRLHLYAKALGIPVIATDACGLREGDGLYQVPFGDEESLRRTVSRVLAREADIVVEPHLLPRQYSDISDSHV